MANIRTGEENAGHIDGDYADRGVGQAGQRSPIVWQVLSALLLLAMGGIHLSARLPVGQAACSGSCSC